MTAAASRGSTWRRRGTRTTARSPSSSGTTAVLGAALVEASHQRRGLSSRLMQAMRSLAEERGMHSLFAPVRPTLKSSYLLTPFERYVAWRRDDGALQPVHMDLHRNEGSYEDPNVWMRHPVREMA
jgi:GNAT superfamily N-acetyltransferase